MSAPTGGLHSPTQQVIDAMARTVDALNAFQRSLNDEVDGTLRIDAITLRSVASAVYGTNWPSAWQTQLPSRAQELVATLQEKNREVLDLRVKLAAAEREREEARDDAARRHKEWEFSCQSTRDVMLQRDAARAELAQVRAALGNADVTGNGTLAERVANVMRAGKTLTPQQMGDVRAWFASYWRANYSDGCVISDREWHLPRLQRALGYAIRSAGFRVEEDA